MVRTTQPTIERARDRLEAEIELVDRERAAFRRFVARLHGMGGERPAPGETSGNGPTPGKTEAGGGPAVATVHEPTPSEGLRSVRTAYRETVMAVSHYDQEYGDTLAESLAAELGETLAGHVVDGQVLTPRLYEALRAASERARDDRSDFLRHLEQERASLCDVAAELNEIESRLVELEGRVDEAPTSAHLGTVDDELAALEGRCTDLANRRQATIHGRSVRKISGVEDASLVQYLYADRLATVTPALSDLADCLDAIRHQRTRCLR
jgi:hypothetical protein